MDKYVAIPLKWPKLTENLKDSEKGRLIDALVAAASGADVSECVPGNEKILLPFLLDFQKDAI